jgi:rod shape determining protein RodA
VIVSGLLALVPFTLVLMQPDLGSALVYLVMWLGLLLFSGIKRVYSLILVVSGILVSWGAWAFALKDYQKNRIISFLNPAADPLGSGYNVIQSKIAVGSGGLFGRGLGHGSQSQLRFLPEQHTDFIFAVLTEELGFLGGFLLLFLFLILFVRMIKAGKFSRDEFGIILAIGAVIIFTFQIFTNVGMNIGILPVTGIPLPLVSYGGSALLIFLMLIGLIESVFVRGRKAEERDIGEEL